MTNLPHNVVSDIVGGGGAGGSVRSYRQTTQTPILHRAVVVDYFSSPRLFTEEEKNSLKERVANPELVDSLPSDSLLVMVVEQGSNFTNELPKLVYPLLPSHFRLPVKPGEHVWLLYTDFSGVGTIVGYWLGRIHENDFVDDPNYTHADRRWFTNPSPPPAFPNGAGEPRTYTLAPLEGGTNPYDNIVNSASGSRTVSYEPVPRYKKQPEELVLEGCNNSLIVLGHLSGSGAMGTIDLVVGRAREAIPFTSGTAPVGSAPQVTTNARGTQEIDKRSTSPNPHEGEVNFVSDASRLWLGMDAGQADVWFRTQNHTNPASGTQYPDNTIFPIQPTDSGKGYGVLKSDNIRIIGRKSTANPAVDGNILLLKEGEKDNDLAFVYLANGKIQIESKEIYVGKSTTKVEPYIKYTEYKKTVEALQAQINTLEEYLRGLTSQLSTAFAASFAIPYQQVAALGAVSSPVRDQFEPSVSNRLSPEKSKIRQSLEDCKSRKIFGE